MIWGEPHEGGPVASTRASTVLGGTIRLSKVSVETGQVHLGRRDPAVNGNLKGTHLGRE